MSRETPRDALTRASTTCETVRVGLWQRQLPEARSAGTQPIRRGDPDVDDRTCPPPKVQRRWPLDPLHRYAAATVGRMVHRPEGYCPGCAFVPSTAHANCLSMVALAELLGVNRKTVQQWKAKGLCDEAADHAAVALGVVPGELWDGWYEAALEVAA